MTVHELHDAIGLLDEELLEQTDRLRTAPRKRSQSVRRYWAAAACLGMLLCGTLAYWFVNNTLRCGSAAPAQFNLEAAPEEAVAAQRSAEDSAAPESAAQDQGPAAATAKTGGTEAAASPASGNANMESGELSQPPALTVGVLTVASGNYTWTVQQDDGTARTVTACGAHPLDDIESLPVLNADGQHVTLDWGAALESVTVRCWPVGQDLEQEAALDGSTLSLQPGDWVYEVNAQFSQGEASYAFRAVWE